MFRVLSGDYYRFRDSGFCIGAPAWANRHLTATLLLAVSCSAPDVSHQNVHVCYGKNPPSFSNPRHLAAYPTLIPRWDPTPGRMIGRLRVSGSAQKLVTMDVVRTRVLMATASLIPSEKPRIPERNPHHRELDPQLLILLLASAQRAHLYTSSRWSILFELIVSLSKSDPARVRIPGRDKTKPAMGLADEISTLSIPKNHGVSGGSCAIPTTFLQSFHQSSFVRSMLLCVSHGERKAMQIKLRRRRLLFRFTHSFSSRIHGSPLHLRFG